MACELNPADWSEEIAILKGDLAYTAGEYLFVLQGPQGLIEGFEDITIGPGSPLAIEFVTPLAPLFRFSSTEWSPECADSLVSIPLNLPGGGFACRPDGKAIGYSKEGDLLQVYYIDLVDFPVVFSMEDGVMQLLFRNVESKYYLTGI